MVLPFGYHAQPTLLTANCGHAIGLSLAGGEHPDSPRPLQYKSSNAVQGFSPVRPRLENLARLFWIRVVASCKHALPGSGPSFVSPDPARRGDP